MQIQATQLSGQANPAQRLAVPAWIWLCGIFLVLMTCVSVAPVGGDAGLYAREVQSSLSHGWSESHQIWNFSHLMWRPLGRVLAELFLNPLLPYFNGNAVMAISFLLVVPNFISALICGLLVQQMVWKMTGNRWAALIAATAFLCLNPLLNYSRLGSPYCCCLACTTLALYLAAFSQQASWKIAVASGILGGIAVIFWAPFLLSFPAIVLSRWILDFDGRKKFDFRFVALMCIAGGLTVVFSYGVALAVMHIHDYSGLMAWLHESTGDSRGQKAMRMVNGFARGFYEMGDDSVWIKWYLFHDPYAKVGFLDLVKLSLGDLMMFYLALLTLVVALWTSALGKRLLALIAIFTIPHLGLGLLYESGSVERYIPFLPAMFLGFGYAIGTPALSFAKRVVIAVICCLHAPVNIATASVRNVSYQVHKDPERLAVMTSSPPNSVLFVVNIRDSLFRLDWGDSLNPLHRGPLAVVSPITPPVEPLLPTWRASFACAVFSTWDHQGQAWISDRVLADQPLRDWMWVEGDLRPMPWTDVHRYFQDFDHSRQRGGPDGFFLLQNTPDERRKLVAGIPGGEQACSRYFQ